ncbi:unnamed protein product [Prunus armeniaca]
MRHEANFIGRIVGEIDRQLNNKRSLDIDFPVGIESRLEKLSKELRIESSNKDVRMVGIWVMRVRAANPGGLVSLQEQLLSETLNRSKMKDVGFVDRGTIMIKEKFQHRKLLVIIDDVDKVEQLEALARSHDWFGPGSRIVITTRDEQLLKPRVDDIYVAEKMDEEEALELFIWHAFKGCHVNEEYVELSRRVVSYCRGLPLALKVLVSSLATQSKEVWESQLDKLNTIPPEDVVNKLRISYKGLDNKDKDIFLDISCFLYWNGQEVCHADIGREIVCEESYYDPGKRSRLWHQEDGTDEIQGLALNLEISEKASFNAQAFENIRRLKLLQLNYVELTDGYKYLSTNMLWMCWHGFPLPSIPNQFDQESLVAMDQQNSKLILVWEESKELALAGCSLTEDAIPKDLRSLISLADLNLGNNGFRRLPSLGGLSKLQKLRLDDCINLTAIPDLPTNLTVLQAVGTSKA